MDRQELIRSLKPVYKSVNREGSKKSRCKPARWWTAPLLLWDAVNSWWSFWGRFSTFVSGNLSYATMRTGQRATSSVLVEGCQSLRSIRSSKSRITSTVRLQAAGPLATAMSPRVERGQHALIVDADFPDGRQPLIQLVHILFRQKNIRKYESDDPLKQSRWKFATS